MEMLDYFFFLCVKPNNQKKKFDLLLIIARQCIYVCRGIGKVPNFHHFKNMIAVTMALMKVNAIQQDKIDLYLKKWEPVTEIL